MRLGLATRIFVGFAGLLLGVVFLSSLSVRQIRSAAQDLRAIRDGHLALARVIAQLETHQQNRLRDLRRALDEPDPRNRAVILRIAVAYYPGVIDASLDALAEACRRLTRGDRGGQRGRHDRAFCAGVRERAAPLEQASLELDRIAERLESRAQAGEALGPAGSTLAERGEALRRTVFELDRYLRAETDAAVTRAERDEQYAVRQVLASTLGALLLGLFVTVLAARALAPIRPLVRYARAIARGDYHQPLELRGAGELTALADELRRMAKARDDREDALDRQAKELERAYLRVADLKRYHERVVHSLRAGVVVTDRGGAITSANRSARHGWELEGVEGRPITELSVGVAVEAHLGPLARLLERREPARAEAVLLGRTLTDLGAAPLEGEDGEVLGLVLTLEDVTEAVRTKEALLRSERLAAIGRMSAHVTHELRNPLASISLNAELLLERGAEADEEARELCRAIGREADRLNALAEEYLRFARLPHPELVETAPKALIEPLAAFVARDCRAAGVELELSVEPNLPPVRVDPDQLRQALLNLVRNGKEAMPEGGLLTLGARRDDDAVELFVRDEGPGVPASVQDRIFDPFYSTKLTGTGLGLALVLQIVQEHGARLQVRSAQGRGAEFVLRFERICGPQMTSPAQTGTGSVKGSA